MKDLHIAVLLVASTVGAFGVGVFVGRPSQAVPQAQEQVTNPTAPVMFPSVWEAKMDECRISVEKKDWGTSFHASCFKESK